MHDEKNTINKFNFSLIKKILVSFLIIFVIFFIFAKIFVEEAIKRQLIKNIIPSITHAFISRSNNIDSFFKNVESIGGNSAEFVKNLIIKPLDKEALNKFSNRYKIINKALRTDLNAFNNRDISCVFLSNKSKLTKEIKEMILKTEKGFRDYAKGVLYSVFNMYFITKDNMIRIYKKDWALEIEADHSFAEDIFYKISTPEYDKERTGKWTAPYYDSILKRWMTSYITPVYVDNEFMGIVGHDIILNKVYEKILKVKTYKNGYFCVFDSENNIIINPMYLKQLNREAKMGDILKISVLKDSGLSASMRVAIRSIKGDKVHKQIFVDNNNNENFFISKKLKFKNWYIAIVIPEKDVLAQLPNLKLRFVLIFSTAVIFLLVIILLILNYFIIRPIKKLTKVSREIQVGNYDTKININNRDEVGELAAAFSKMTSVMEHSILNMKKELNRREEIEKALFESNEKFKKVFEYIPYVVSLTSRVTGNFAELNLSFETLTGYSRDGALTKSLLDYDLWQDSTKRDDIIEIINEKGSVQNMPFLLKRKDGKLRHCLLSAEEIEIKNEKFIVSLVRDITEQEKVRKEKKVLEERLERSKKLEALGTLAGGVAHDLNNILSGLVSYPDMLLMQIPKESTIRKSLITIKESGIKAANIVQDLLTLGRRGVITTTVINLNDLVKDYLSSLEYKRLTSYHPDIIIKKNLKDGLFNIIGSKIQLLKAIMNLVSNAMESMKKGGVLTITTKNRYIDREIQGYETIKEGNYAIFVIGDEGIGISTSDLERIFEPFYTKKKMGRSGTGLGMAVVWGAVKDHKGFIDIKSELGKGTEFTLYFPITNKELSRTDDEVDLKDYQGKGERILVVDDIEEQRELAYDILTRMGYSVNFVESGEKAIEYLKVNKADLVLLDMIMEPGIDGLETYRRIIEISQNQKTIIVSGFSETERVQEAIKLGVKKYIKKPYSVESLSKAVKRIFN